MIKRADTLIALELSLKSNWEMTIEMFKFCCWGHGVCVCVWGGGGGGGIEMEFLNDDERKEENDYLEAREETKDRQKERQTNRLANEQADIASEREREREMHTFCLNHGYLFVCLFLSFFLPSFL